MKNTDKKQMGCIIKGEMKKDVEEYLNDTRMPGTIFLRKGIQMMLDDNKEEGQLVMNLICLTQKIQEMKSDLNEQDYKEIEKLLGNMTRLKSGGK